MEWALLMGRAEVTTMSSTTRLEARTRGLRLAAKVATVGGIAMAALGMAAARSASAAATAPRAAAGETTSSTDDAKALPLEDWAKAAKGGGCGCSPCWGPPAPPEKRS